MNKYPAHTYVPEGYTLSNARIIKHVPINQTNATGAIPEVHRIPIDRPTFVTFGGELTCTDGGAKAYARMLYKVLLENGVPDLNLYSIAYNFGSWNAFLERNSLFWVAHRKLDMLSYNDDIKLARMTTAEPMPQYVTKLHDILLKPRFATPDGNRIPTDDAISYMRKIKFYAHCHGASTIMMMARKMRQDMERTGYTPNEISAIQKNLMVIQHNPIAPLENPAFTTFSFASADDTQMYNHNNLFSRYLLDNSENIVPSYFNTNGMHLFVAGQLKIRAGHEHDNCGMLRVDSCDLTDDGKIIFGAERNAVVRAARDAIAGAEIPGAEIVNGNGVDFNKMKENGDYIFKIMLNNLRQQNPKRDYQK